MHHYLRTDGLLVLKLVRLNMGVNTTTEIVENLFKHFKTLDTSLKYSDSLDTLASYRTNDGTLGAPSVGNPSIGNPSRPVSPSALGKLGRGGGGGGGGGGGANRVMNRLNE